MRTIRTELFSSYLKSFASWPNTTLASVQDKGFLENQKKKESQLRYCTDRTLFKKTIPQIKRSYFVVSSLFARTSIRNEEKVARNVLSIGIFPGFNLFTQGDTPCLLRLGWQRQGSVSGREPWHFKETNRTPTLGRGRLSGFLREKRKKEKQRTRSAYRHLPSSRHQKCKEAFVRLFRATRFRHYRAICGAGHPLYRCKLNVGTPVLTVRVAVKF